MRVLTQTLPALTGLCCLQHLQLPGGSILNNIAIWRPVIKSHYPFFSAPLWVPEPQWPTLKWPGYMTTALRTPPRIHSAAPALPPPRVSPESPLSSPLFGLFSRTQNSLLSLRWWRNRHSPSVSISINSILKLSISHTCLDFRSLLLKMCLQSVWEGRNYLQIPPCGVTKS